MWAVECSSWQQCGKETEARIQLGGNLEQIHSTGKTQRVVAWNRDTGHRHRAQSCRSRPEARQQPLSTQSSLPLSNVLRRMHKTADLG